MGKINACLKKLFIFFNLLFAIAGGIVIGLAMLSQLYSNETQLEGRTTGLITLYVVGGVTMAMSLLGAYGAYKEKKIPLIMFLSAMCIGCLGLLRVGIPVAVARPQLEGVLEDRFRTLLLPLDNASEEIKNVADHIQTMFRCCGLFSYEDWRQSIPESCSCQREAEEEGLCQRVSYRASFFRYNSVEKEIYKKTCFPIIMSYISMVADAMLGVLFAFASLALLGAVLSSIMLNQLRNTSPRPPVVFSVPIFSAQPPKYTELYNTAEK